MINSSENVIEKLAALEHDQWVQWANSLMQSEDLSEERIQRWIPYMVPYSELEDDVKEHDRKWARKALTIVLNSIREN